MFALSFSSVKFHTKTSLTSLPADISQTAVCICMRATRGEQPTRLLLEKSRTEEAKRSKGTLTGKDPSIASGLLCFLSTASYRPIPLRPLFFFDNCVLLLQLLTKKNRFISSRLIGVLFLWHELTRTRTPFVMWLSARSLFLSVWQPKRHFFFFGVRGSGLFAFALKRRQGQGRPRLCCDAMTREKCGEESVNGLLLTSFGQCLIYLSIYGQWCRVNS